MNAALKYHPLADVFPLIEGDEFAALVADIKERGLLHPIALYEGKILDGRNRYRACEEAGVTIRTWEYDGDDPIAFVIASNLLRRHLDESQRAMAADRLADMQQGARTDLAQICAKSQEEAADLMNVSRRAVQHARKVRRRGTRKLANAVDNGKIKVSTAAKLADMSPEVQDRAASEPDKAPHIAKQERRRQREADLAQATLAASKQLGAELYGVIYADPPWRFEPYSDQTGMDRAADNHYQTMTLDDIRALPIPAADDAVLFLWATVPMLPQALDVMAVWGFTYKSHFAWVKDRAGTGYWVRNKHELLLIGTRGSIPAPAPGEQYESVIEAKVQQHSAKPFHFHEIIEEMFPTLPRIELFAREQFVGWDSWGNETSDAAA